MKKLTLIIPAKYESESLPKVLDSLKDIDSKIIVSLKDSDFIASKILVIQTP